LEIPGFAGHTYWLPERFFREKLHHAPMINSGEKCIVAGIDQDGSFSLQDKKINLFANDFWRAEMHGEEEKNASRKAKKGNDLYA
jgi:hypothetical protein